MSAPDGQWKHVGSVVDNDLKQRGLGVREVVCAQDTVLTASATPVLKVWQLAEGQLVAKTRFNLGVLGANSMHVSESGNLCVICCSDGSVGLWDVRTGKRVDSTDVPITDGFATRAKFTRGEHELVWAGPASAAHVVDLRNNTTQALGSEPESKTPKRRKQVQDTRQDRSTVFSLDASLDGQWIACGRGSGTLSLFESEYRRWAGDFQAHMGQAPLSHTLGHPSNPSGNTPVRALSFDPTSSYLISGGDDGKVCVLDIRHATTNGKSMSSSVPSGMKVRATRRFVAHKHCIASLATCRHQHTDTSGNLQSLVVTTDLAGVVKLWDIQRQEPLKVYHDHTGAVLASSFAMDGSFFVTAGADSALALYSAQSQQTGES
mmetsp:Transcript_69870/g.130552  ORF Transcript_69870/g.130552 Transcript_69870/m.130552 type:complete len:376 (-) Transcript_69870:37-1164(-)